MALSDQIYSVALKLAFIVFLIVLAACIILVIWVNPDSPLVDQLVSLLGHVFKYVSSLN